MAGPRRGRRGGPLEAELGLPIQPGREDGLHRRVAILPHRVGPGAGGVEARRPVALGQAEDALRPAQPIERALAEEARHEERAGGADRGRLLLAPPWGLEQEVHLIRGQVVQERPPLPGPGGNCVCPKCGKTMPHQRGVPCLQVMCPDCGTAMARQP